MSTTTPYIKLVEQVLISVEQIGVEKTINCLQNELKKSFHDNAHSVYVLEKVSQVLEIPVKEILYGTGRKNDRKYGVGFSSYYLHYHFKYDMEEVKYMLNKNLWVCYKYMDKIKHLNPAHISDQKFLDHKVTLDQFMSDYKGKL